MVLFGAFIMLLVMTFNAGIFFTVIIGQTFGFILTPNADPIKKGIAEGFKQTEPTYLPYCEHCCTVAE